MSRFRNVAKQLTASRASYFASQLSTLSYKRHTEGYLLLAYLACRALTSAS